MSNVNSFGTLGFGGTLLGANASDGLKMIKLIIDKAYMS
jgi:hypothetical protein